MKIGIVGCGVVGSACAFGFKKLGHKVFEHDLKLNTKIDIVLDSQIVYLCVPTPMNEDGSCDASIVESVIKELYYKKYRGIVAIKSTVWPGFTESMERKYEALNFAFVPEFLRERCAITDFVELNKILVIGCNEPGIKGINAAYYIRCSHGDYPQAHLECSTTEAELIKYFHNTFNALRVTFANECRQICDSLGANYTHLKKALIKSSGVPDQYLDSNDEVLGWSSICWNKDIPALYHIIKTRQLDLPLITAIIPSNDKLKKTPFEKTRENY